MNVSEWKILWDEAHKLQHDFPEGIVFIGGVAIAAYASDEASIDIGVPFSHDVDFMISMADYGDLKDFEAITPNRRLSKGQFEKNGFEFDVYVEHKHDLPVPYGEIMSDSVMKSGLRVASIGHLIVLKLAAMIDRGHSPKGEKDRDDIFRLLVYASNSDIPVSSVARINDEHVGVIQKIVKSDAALRIANQNSHLASSMRRLGQSGLEKIDKAIQLSKNLQPEIR
jgi:hypothetical protein